MKCLSGLLSLMFLVSGCATVITPYHSTGLPPKNLIFTFDDGPNAHSNTTERILEVLDRHHIKAYFDVIGLQVEKNPELVRKIQAGGHVLSNHS